MPRSLASCARNRMTRTGSSPRAKQRWRAATPRPQALRFYQAQLGAPKNKRLLKALQESGVKQLVQRMELDHIADRKQPAAKQQFRDIEERLLFVLDERGHTVHLTDRGADLMSPGDPDAFLLPDISEEVHRIDHDRDRSTPQEKLDARAAIERAYAERSERLNIVHQLLRAHALYEKDVNYVVQDGQVLIVDEFTGRTMPGRRWSEGLHQAVEAKEGVQVKGETQTMATITIQNYFRMYEKLSGMTGTAETEETEFHDIYKLDVAVIPTNKPVIRDDRQDWIYRTRREKYNAILEETQRLHDARLSGARGNRERRCVGDARAHVPARRHQAQRAEREVPPARGRDRRGSGAAWRGDDRDEHGRPRNRHQARRGRDGVEAVEGQGS